MWITNAVVAAAVILLSTVIGVSVEGCSSSSGGDYSKDKFTMNGAININDYYTYVIYDITDRTTTCDEMISKITSEYSTPWSSVLIGSLRVDAWSFNALLSCIANSPKRAEGAYTLIDIYDIKVND